MGNELTYLVETKKAELKELEILQRINQEKQKDLTLLIIALERVENKLNG